KNQAILSSIADGVIVFDMDGRATVANPAIKQLLNRHPDQITGLDIEAVMGRDVDPIAQQTIVNFVKTRQQGSAGDKFEWGQKTLSVSLAAVRDGAEQPTGTVVVFRDYTREAEVDRMKSAFVSMVSHELRTPLNAILGYGDMLKEEVFGPLSKPQNSTMDRVIANAKHMLGLVNNLLDQAQIEAGRLTLDKAPFCVQDLVGELESVMGVLARQKHLTLECMVTPDVPEQIVSDARRLSQILVNLVGNAIKFTQDGTVTVCVKRPSSAQWSLVVSDTGAGIPPEAQAYIFEPFRQVDDSITRDQSGSGLGLSIVKQLVNLLGGDITLESAVGKGSTFTIVLPLITPKE
ncbi:MAG: PAS domain-containing sensor histidine kinase, partial [Chloroflexi bacterium]|nr:PAS domain-containing sensor histidine kinase [Chloroflexota bacterium]